MQKIEEEIEEVVEQKPAKNLGCLYSLILLLSIATGCGAVVALLR